MHRYLRGYNVNTSRSYRPILIIVLLLLAAFLIFKFAGVGGLNESNFETQRNARLRDEMQNAVSNVNNLSRYGATSSSNILGKIRQHVHGMELLNDLNISLYGDIGRLYNQSDFDQIYSIIESYDAKLSSGQKVNETLAALTEAVERLNVQTLTLLSNLNAT